MSSVQTMRAWPTRVGLGDEIPHPFQRAFSLLQLRGPGDPEILHAPRFKSGGQEILATLLVRDGDRVTCLEARHGGVVASVVTLGDVHHAEWGHALLSSWLQLDAFGAGGPATIRVEFHSMGRELYRPLLDAVRIPRYAHDALEARAYEARLRGVATEDYRLYRFGLDALLPGAELHAILYQPRVTERRFGVLQGIRVPATLLLATQAELILIREGPVRGEGAYTGIWSFLPLDRVRALALEPDPDREVLTLRAHLAGGQDITCTLDPDREHDATAFAEAIRGGQDLTELPLSAGSP